MEYIKNTTKAFDNQIFLWKECVFHASYIDSVPNDVTRSVGVIKKELQNLNYILKIIIESNSFEDAKKWFYANQKTAEMHKDKILKYSQMKYLSGLGVIPIIGYVYQAASILVSLINLYDDLIKQLKFSSSLGIPIVFSFSPETLNDKFEEIKKNPDPVKLKYLIFLAKTNRYIVREIVNMNISAIDTGKDLVLDILQIATLIPSVGFSAGAITAANISFSLFLYTFVEGAILEVNTLDFVKLCKNISKFSQMQISSLEDSKELYLTHQKQQINMQDEKQKEVSVEQKDESLAQNEKIKFEPTEKITFS